MEFIGHILLVAFIGLIVFATFSAGVVLLIWFTSFAIAVSVLVMLRGWIRRWWFLYVSRDRSYSRKPPQVIEVDYRDISDEE